MMTHIRTLTIAACSSLLLLIASCDSKLEAPPVAREIISQPDSLLRHVVLFKFKASSSPEDVMSIEKAFKELSNKISEIYSYEWGLNNSPEGLEKGFTHCFFLTFKSEEDRAIYLPHPDHKAFGELLGPHLEDVLVVDYWTK